MSVHDGPVTKMERSPHNRHLLLTVGGYSWAIWNEGEMVGQFKNGSDNFIV